MGKKNVVCLPKESGSTSLRKATEADKERKREKARMKRQLKRKLKAQSGQLKDQGKAKSQALEYLLMWKKNRSQWTFKKNKQCWLLRNVYNFDNISDKDFKILLNYLAGLQGAARERLIQEAENKMESAEISESNKNEDEFQDNENDDKTQRIVERARSVLQTVV